MAFDKSKMMFFFVIKVIKVFVCEKVFILSSNLEHFTLINYNQLTIQTQKPSGFKIVYFI